MPKVTTTPPTGSETGTRFDWYAATISDSVHAVIDTLAAELRGEVEESAPRLGYGQAHLIRRDGQTRATVLSGGKNGVHGVHAFASGQDTDPFVPVVRGHWPTSHRVSRMDAAQDSDGPGTWDRLYGVIMGYADELHATGKKLKVNQAGDWHHLESGRTLYLGSPTSAVMLRLYEKGKQLRGEELDHRRRAAISPDLCRVEVQVRPEGDAKKHAATATPEEAFGYARWTVEVARRLLSTEVEWVHIKQERESDRDRALTWMLRQYGAHLIDLAMELGGGRDEDWSSLGLNLRDRLSAIRDELPAKPEASTGDRFQASDSFYPQDPGHPRDRRPDDEHI